ncbi:MAG: 30S ribosomal protein S1, partial [Wenyingzhuangia sp.]
MSEENTKAVEAQEQEAVQVNPQEFLADFNWHKYEEGIDEVDEAQLKEFDAALEGTVGFVNERDVIEGTVVRIT